MVDTTEKAITRTVQIGRRDLDILRSTYNSVCLSTSQIAALHFPSQKKASERLKRLVTNGLLKQSRHSWQFESCRNEHFYALSAKGRGLLGCAEVDQANFPRTATTIPRNLEHLASINQFRILLGQACKQMGTLSLTFEPAWRFPAADNYIGRFLKPDAAIWLSHTSGRSLLFFLEIDRDTEPLTRRDTGTQTSVLGKLQRYCQCFDSEAYRNLALQLFKGTPNGFRVLLATTNQARIGRLSTIVSEFGDTHFVWATTFADLAYNRALSRIWQIVSPGSVNKHSIVEPYKHPELPDKGKK